MQIPQISMQSQMAQIQIRQTKGIQEIKQPNAELSIQQPHAALSIQTTPAKLQIDQTQAWEDMNLMHIFRQNEKVAEEGKNSLLEGIGRRAEQGSELMKLENEGAPVINQAIMDGNRQNKSLGIKFIPSQFAVKTSYEPAQVQIEVQTNKPIVEASTQKPIHNFERGTVMVDMEQYQQLEMDVVYND